MSEGAPQDAAFNSAFREGLRLLNRGEAAAAAARLMPLHAQAPEDVEVALNLGGAYILLGRYEEASVILEQAAERDPENANLWVNVAAARLGPLEQSSDPQKDAAIQAYHRALAADPETPNVHYMLGLVHRSRQDNLRAAAHFTRALEQNPEDRDARRMLSAIASETVARSDQSDR